MKAARAGVPQLGKNPSFRWIRLTSNIALLLAIVILIWIGSYHHHGSAMMVSTALDRGFQRVTAGHLTLGIAGEVAVLASALFSIRWLTLEFLAVMGGRIEVRPLDNASGDDVGIHELDAAFREYLALPKLYQLTTIPGDPEPEHLVEVLKVSYSSGWRGLAAAAFSYAFPRRAFIVSASLRKQDHQPRFGVAVQVRRLPGLAAELETQWSTSFERALQRGAYAAVAHILPQTTACRSTPWAQWRNHSLPASLFRDYQRAKKMIAERRYDEALNLYHRALIKDPNNISMRYDVGQLYERLGLYPDALLIYLNLVNELFPVKSEAKRKLPRRNRRVLGIWYRYLVVLAMGRPLVSELLFPDWAELRDWLRDPVDGSADVTTEERPLRAFELLELRRLIDSRLAGLYGRYIPRSQPRSEAVLPRENLNRKSRKLEEWLLSCAEIEVNRLEGQLRRPLLRYYTWRKGSAVTRTAVRQTKVMIALRRDLIGPVASKNKKTFAPANIRKSLKDSSGYSPADSVKWLEHYNAACAYALVLRDDDAEERRHLPNAYAAVSALELASRYGEDVGFIQTKSYWLQAGDPDLAGLRRYNCFRAFETRVYGRPLPTTAKLDRYEQYLYLRTVLENSAGHLEREWRKRAAGGASPVTHENFEEWWRQERHAWELAIRLGRFYRQWQTRQEAVESRRNWLESFGSEARSVPYPRVDLGSYVADIGDYLLTEDKLAETEIIFRYLGHDCGSLIPSAADERGRDIMSLTRRWSSYAERCARSLPRNSIMTREVIDCCRGRVALWAALRQWAKDPSPAQRQAFALAADSLAAPPLDPDDPGDAR